MPDFSLCSNLECPLRDNCKRAMIYDDNKPNQSYTTFSFSKIITVDNEITYFCKFQKPIK